jgi:hypothetical protein
MFFSDGHWKASIVEKTGDGNFMTQGVTSRLWEEEESDKIGKRREFQSRGSI